MTTPQPPYPGPPPQRPVHGGPPHAPRFAAPPPARPRRRTWLTILVALATAVGLWAVQTIPTYLLAKTVEVAFSQRSRPPVPSADGLVAAIDSSTMRVERVGMRNILSSACSDATQLIWFESPTGWWNILLSQCASEFAAASDLSTHINATQTWEGSDVLDGSEVNIHLTDGRKAKVWVQGTLEVWVAAPDTDAETLDRLDEIARLAAETLPGEPNLIGAIKGFRLFMIFGAGFLVVFVLPLVVARLMRRRLTSPDVLTAPDGVPAYRDITPAAKRAAQGLVWSKRARGTAIVLVFLAALIPFADDPPPVGVPLTLLALAAAGVLASFLLRRRAPKIRRAPHIPSARPAVAIGRGLRRGTALFVPIWVVVALVILGVPSVNIEATEIRMARLNAIPSAMLGMNPSAFLISVGLVSAEMLLATLLVTGIMPITVAYFVDRLGRRLASPTSDELMAADPRPPVLYLRSFDEDRLSLAASATVNSVMQRLSPWRRRRFEEFLAEELGRLGPVVAISPPGTKLPPLGAARMTLGNDEWQQRVHEIAQQAICVVMSATPDQVRAGLHWEISYLGTHVQHGRILLVVAPWKVSEVRRRFSAFLEVASTFPMFRWLRGYPAPDGTHVLWRVPDGRWRSLGTRWRDDISYTVTLATAADEALGSWMAGLHPVPRNH